MVQRRVRGPTAAQEQAWPAIASGEHVLISAPTGSGKTLAAFLYAIDQLASEPAAREPERARTSLVYVSPLKALSYDIDRNLRTPLRGIGAELTVAVRTGDTPQSERQRMLREPPDILITTPESLYLMLTGRAQQMFEGVALVIVDEIHAVASTKRGAHLALTLERLIAGGRATTSSGSACRPPRTRSRRSAGSWSARSAAAGSSTPACARSSTSRSTCRSSRWSSPTTLPRPTLDPLEGGTEATRRSIWPAIYPELLELIQAHKSTILFVNNRRGAERLALRLNELAGERDRPRHHGSLAREERTVVEEMLKAGELPCLVATSSLELGIDMGAVDLVIQVESPKSVARGLQRIGRAGHSVGDVSRGPDLPQVPRRPARVRGGRAADARGRRSRRRSCRATRSTCSPSRSSRSRRASTRSRSASTSCSRSSPAPTPSPSSAARQLENVLDMLDGRYPSSEFAELRPRIVWDRVAGTIRARPGARQLAVTNAGTIPDRGLYAVTLPDGRRVGELDEEMVYEARPGQTFLLGATTWRIEEIGRDRVIVTPAPGLPGRGPVLEGRRDRPPRASSARRSAPSRAGPWTSRPKSSSATTTSTARAAKQPGRVPARAAAGHPRRPLRPDDRGRALPRRDRRLAAVRPEPVRRPRPRRLGARARAPGSATSSGSSPTRSTPTTGSSSTSPTPRSRRAPTW